MYKNKFIVHYVIEGDDIFMKRTSIIFIAIIAAYIVIGNVSAKKLIPDEAIRMRVIPNSNDTYDQNIKGKVRDAVQNKMYNLLKDTKGIEEARDIIKENIASLDHTVSEVLIKENYNLGYQVDYGKHYFPEKVYKGVTYDEGMYESILITLGKGEGDNWWCVLFPPLCLIEAEESSDVEYKSFVKELIDKYL